MLGLDARVSHALMLTSLGAAGTGLGGLLVVLQPKLSFKKLGYLQGLAAGLMMAISFFDLLPESVEAVGSQLATFWFFVGVVFFAVIVAFIPEPDSLSFVLDVGDDAVRAAAPHKAYHDSPSSALRRRKVSRPTMGTKEAPVTKEARKKVLLSGLITALGIALHNFPEGVAVFLASIKSERVGLSLALAIALHNIPEGVAVALPVYFATGSRWKGFWYAFVSGLAEPAAVLVMGVVFHAFWLDKTVIDCLLAAVGGIMCFLSLHELLPLAIEHAGKTAAVLSLFVGMAIMAANLMMLDAWFLH